MMRLLSTLALFGTLAALLAAVPGRAQAPEAEWKVGLAAVKLTPDQPVFLAGYANRNKPYSKVELDIWAKAMVLEDREGHRGVLVTSDVLGLPASIAEPICARIREKTGIPREQVVLNSAHTHSAPIVSADDATRDNVPPAEAQKIAEYSRQLQDRIVDAVTRAAAAMAPARLTWGTGLVHFVMNRREYTPNGIILGVNPRGLADRTVPVLRVEGADGALRAVLFGAAVHGTTLGGNDYELCGDYAGFAQDRLQQRHPGTQAMFMLGCAGDANPYPRGGANPMDQARAHGQTLADEVDRVLTTVKLQPVRGPLRTAFARVDLPLQPVPPRAELEKLAAGRSADAFVARQQLGALDRGETLPATYRAPFAVWQLGQDLTLVALSGEVVSDYVPLLEKALGPLRLWLSAYSNDLYGYLPSARVVEEGGYENRGLYAGGIGHFAPGAEEVVVKAVRELARQAGRPLPP